MADEEPTTPAQAVEQIREALIDVEELFPDSWAVKRLHKLLEKGLREHHGKLGIGDDEVEALAGGGTPKTPGRP